MKSRSLTRPGRTAGLATLLLALTISAAIAKGSPPVQAVTVPGPPTPLDSLNLPYVQNVIVGHAACATCPPITCVDEPVQVTVTGLRPACVQFRGLHEQQTNGLFPVVVAEFVVDTCRANCPDLIVPFAGGTTLPPQPGGWHSLVVRVNVRTCADTLAVVDSSETTVDYLVRTDCAPPPIPPDSLVQTFVRLGLVPEHPCAGDTVTLQLLKNGCPPCVHLLSFGHDSTSGSSFAGVFEWRPNCLELACNAETLSASMGRLNAGSYHVSAPMTVHVIGTANPDSTLQFRLPLDFQVGPTCGGPPPLCVVREMESNVPSNQCALTIAPRDTGDVPLLYSSDLPMAGVQGSLHVPAPFRLTDLRLASHLTGVHLSWYMVRGALDETRWVVFTDPGVSLAPGVGQHLLDASITVDPMVPRGFSQLMTASITLASDADGHELPLCNRETAVVVAIRLCVVAAENTACDVNHDGRLDVRDLVRMVGCLRHAGADTSGACVDCDSSGVFDIADIFCCAGDILRGPGVPRDSLRADAAVSVTFDPIESMGNGSLLVRVRVRGARALNVGQLRLDYPGDRWQVAPPVSVASGTRPADVDWYPILDYLEAGHIYFGALRTGDVASDEFTCTLVMTPLATPLRDPTTTDRLQVMSADLAAVDGSVVTPKDPLPSVLLEASRSPEITAVELAPARPNPFNGSTTFVIRLPSTAPVDLAVHDLAGRRIATIARAVYGPGEHSFSWDGAGARDGVYFVRLSVNGQVLSTRVAMLRDGR